MIRCRNFRRLSSQSDECYRTRGRRDSSTQIIDGTLATMAVETSSTLFDSSTQTGKSFSKLFIFTYIRYIYIYICNADKFHISFRFTQKNQKSNPNFPIKLSLFKRIRIGRSRTYYIDCIYRSWVTVKSSEIEI